MHACMSVFLRMGCLHSSSFIITYLYSRSYNHRRNFSCFYGSSEQPLRNYGKFNKQGDTRKMYVL